MVQVLTLEVLLKSNISRSSICNLSLLSSYITVIYQTIRFNLASTNS